MVIRCSDKCGYHAQTSSKGARAALNNRGAVVSKEDLKMVISGVGQNYYQNNVETKRNTKNVNGTEKIDTGKAESTQELSEAEEMELRGYQRIEQLPIWQSIYRRRHLKI